MRDLLFEIRLSDLIDIALLTIVIYRFLLLIRGTRTIPIMVGLTVVLGGTYVLAKLFNLDATGWLVENLVGSAVVILVILFQADIRNALAQLGLTTMFREVAATDEETAVEVVVQAAFSLARRRIGALMVLEREGGLRNYMEAGKPIGALPSVEILESIFHTSSPLHDGAVIFNRAGRIASAACILPLSARQVKKGKIGTRHRAALGLAEETDAVVVVVSEERGQVSLAYRGELEENLDKAALTHRLSDIVLVKEREDGVGANPKTA